MRHAQWPPGGRFRAVRDAAQSPWPERRMPNGLFPATYRLQNTACLGVRHTESAACSFTLTTSLAGL